MTISDAWATFDYEVQMYRDLGQLMRAGTHKHLQWPIGNAIVESHLLHIRVLSELLTQNDCRDDDVRLRDLVGDFVPERLEELRKMYRGQDVQRGLKWQVDKRLAHATKARSSGHDHADMLNEYCPVLDEVLAQVEQRKPQAPQR